MEPSISSFLWHPLKQRISLSEVQEYRKYEPRIDGRMDITDEACSSQDKLIHKHSKRMRLYGTILPYCFYGTHWNNGYISLRFKNKAYSLFWSICQFYGILANFKEFWGRVGNLKHYYTTIYVSPWKIIQGRIFLLPQKHLCIIICDHCKCSI